MYKDYRNSTELNTLWPFSYITLKIIFSKRVLGFYRVPPTVGRVFNMTTEIFQKADSDFTRTFYFSPGICPFLYSIFH